MKNKVAIPYSVIEDGIEMEVVVYGLAQMLLSSGNGLQILTVNMVEDNFGNPVPPTQYRRKIIIDAFDGLVDAGFLIKGEDGLYRVDTNLFGRLPPQFVLCDLDKFAELYKTPKLLYHYIILNKLSNKEKHTCYSSLEKIGEEENISTVTVESRNRELEKRGLIKTNRGYTDDGRKKNSYLIVT